MVLGIKGLFPPGREVFVNFDWQDVADLTGYINYNLWRSIDSVGSLRHLIPSSIASGHNLDAAQESGTPTTSTSFVKITDTDYDLTALQLPRTLRGKVLLKLAFRLIITATSATCQAFIIIKLRKWDGSSETEIASVQSITLEGATTGTFIREVNLILQIPTTLIKKGEVIRITCEGWAKSNSGSAAANVSALFKPATGDSIITLPYRMDI